MTEPKVKRRHANVAHLDEVEPSDMGKGSKFGHTHRRLSKAAGGLTLGCTWYEVPPGKSAFPAHYHAALEEAIYVLEGEGTMRIGKDSVPVRAGDYVAFLTGPEHAHRLNNTGSGPLRYLAMSSRPGAEVEVVGYPDSGKVAFTAGSYDKPLARGILRNGVATTDYWDGEEVD